MLLSHLEPVFLGFTCSRAGIIHVNSRFRRDVRTLEEEEEQWFEQEDENGEETVALEQNDLLNDDSAFKNRKTFVNAKPPPSIVNNKRVSISAVSPVSYLSILAGHVYFFEISQPPPPPPPSKV